MKPGFRALFYGPEGTGKTLAASLLGQATARKVYRVDLSVGISKYIGETEKNLATVFDRAQKNNWILFFDEADALFGKRTVVKDAHDRYANQEVAYLLQRVEDYPGVVIFASNLKANIDEAFSRRFQSMIHFSMPNAEQRLMLWKKTFSGAMQVAPDLDWEKIAVSYEISGGDMLDVLQYCALTAVQRKPPVVQSRDILAGIRRVMQKHGKIR
ncbi:MAG: ATP-binding protein [Lewinellaceae bacterium]|nr:ATP-binding protein [Lewinellaceae bacterium]